jgi:NADH:ubiquinone oxidoreductase subunit
VQDVSKVVAIMKYRIAIIIGITTTIFSCKSLKYPTGTEKFIGTFKTCSLDTMVYLTESTLKMVDTNDNLNVNCENRPEYSKVCPSWPGNMHLYFKDKQFIAGYNIREYDKDKKSVVIHIDSGSLKYDKKSKTITLHSTVFNWTKTFKIEYVKGEKALILKAINE